MYLIFIKQTNKFASAGAEGTLIEWLEQKDANKHKTRQALSSLNAFTPQNISRRELHRKGFPNRRLFWWSAFYLLNLPDFNNESESHKHKTAAATLSQQQQHPQLAAADDKDAFHCLI